MPILIISMGPWPREGEWTHTGAGPWWWAARESVTNSFLEILWSSGKFLTYSRRMLLFGLIMSRKNFGQGWLPRRFGMRFCCGFQLNCRMVDPVFR